MKIITQYTVSVLTSVALLACGGGGSSSSVSTPPNAIIEGAWTGTSSSGYTISALSLEDGSTFAIFGTASGSVFEVAGFDQGTLSTSGNALSGSVREYTSFGAVSQGKVSGTAITGSSIAATVQFGAATTTVNLSPIPRFVFDYNSAATLPAIEGLWSGTLLDGSDASMAVDSRNGGIVGRNRDCTFTGKAVPRPSGKNVYNITLTFGPGPCAWPDQTTTGIALTYPTTGSERWQLLVAVQDATKTMGTTFVAAR